MWYFINDKCESLHCSQEQVEEYWAGNCSDGNVSALLKLIPTPEKSCSQDKQMDVSNHSRFGMTLRRSTAIRGVDELTWFQGDSPVRTYHQQEGELELTASGQVCGPSLPGSLARCNPPMPGWKTRQYSLQGDLIEFSGTWPRWGMMRDGEFWVRNMPAALSIETGCGYVPAPVKNMAEGFLGGPIRSKETWKTTSRQDHWLIGIWKNWTGRENNGRIKWKVTSHPTFCAWSMGWPMNWTRLKPLAMDKFQQWLRSHGEYSQWGLP